MLVLALASATLPISKAAACSCVSFETADELVAAHAVTFIGTVVDKAEGGPIGFGGPNVRYAFDVERASEPTGPRIVVHAEGASGGSTCGFEFGIGERWLTAAYWQEGDLETNLCSGNRPVRELAAVEVAAYEALLTEVPAEAEKLTEPIARPDFSVPAAIAIAVLGALVLGGVSLLAVRRRRSGS